MSHIASTFTRLIRFTPKSNPSQPLIGEPLDPTLDVGLAIYHNHDVRVAVFSGLSVLNPGTKTERIETIHQLLSPLSSHEVGTIRCIGLNYTTHAKEMSLPLPTIPTLFLKPSTALSSPYPTATTKLPKISQLDGTADYEAELAVVLGREAKDVPEDEAMQYVLGYTAANDVSSRTAQMAQSQWCFSKGFDGGCPLGPAIVSATAIPDGDVGRMHIRGLKNGVVMQDCSLSDLIFTVPKLVSFLSQGTTLPAGTVILTGTPAGVGAARTPREFLRAGDEFFVEVGPGVGTLVSRFENQ
ncbi:hypothetical protein BJX61DRAFT_531024 [Aspergillus egyptiacus]|nr:hypothetical protein BJX61DRAFT_531024 [Aspergillus egyptiacus]